MNITHPIALAALLTATSSVAMAAPKKGSVPPELVGKWRWTSVSATNYENTTTGAWESGSGMSTTLTFTKDGRYSFFFYAKVRTYNVVTEASTTSSGTVTWKDGEFTIHPTKGHYLGWFNGRKKTDRNMTAAERKKNNDWYWKWETKYGKRALMMGMSPTVLSQYKKEG